MNWLEGLDNEQRRHHRKAQNPDLPHQFRARRVTNKNDPKLTLKEWVFTGGRWRHTMTGSSAVSGLWREPRRLEAPMKPCPGYPDGSCLTWIQDWADLCTFCRKTQLLEENE